ncbi:MAG: right-handed parallel beta-helix repeat-containing protein [Deltaproteobacteria bacterium]|nr:MAG: right-handed parallel beta-helix repeat-containing protein [Deltaproteobacteria bacterium]
MTPRRAARILPILLACGIAACAGAGKAPDGKLPADGIALPIRGLAGDETWSGEVRIRGSVVVPRGVTLTIAPGTVVRFEKIDVDGDGIGDSELYVEGNLLAEGTPGSPIRFTSAERNPSPRDWKYLFVNLSRRTVLSRCVSEYAFSGIQIHFSRATVTRSVFRRCVDGFRFSTAEGVFSRNRMTENVYGVRYEERNSTAILSRNDITGNKVGIFCVMESTGKVAIRENRIHGNADYDFKLGNRQRADIPAEGNWWGTTDPAAIRARIFDRGVEPDLGGVLFEPFLAAPPPDDGGYGT